MKKSLTCALLVDDDRATNFFNKSIVSRHSDIKEVVTKENATRALAYLDKASKGLATIPDIIFLDLNMPAMNGWEFITEFQKLDSNFTSKIKLVILTTSSNPDDFMRSQDIEAIDDYINKPLSLKLIDELLENHFYNISPKL